jgi:hypothetical protein
MLTMIGVFVAVMFAVLGVISWRYAPAVTVACCAGLAIGGLALYVVLHHPQPDAPTTVALAASAGIGLGGLIGLLATPRGDARSLRRAGVASLTIAPCVGAALAVSLEAACPMYVVGAKAGLCRYGIDVLGGWLGPTAALAVVDVVVIGLLFLVSGRIASASRNAVARATVV